MVTSSDYLCYSSYGVEYRHQDISHVFVNAGSVFISTYITVLARSLFGTKADALIISKQENVDINMEFNLWVAKKFWKGLWNRVRILDLRK